MFEKLIIDPHWILAFRTEELTRFFKLFLLLDSDFFYLTAVALGYWFRPKSLLFKSLGFLVPFSSFFNFFIKSIFQISRPESSMHLVSLPADDGFGFPSGSVQIATVFWLSIFAAIKISNPLRYLCFLPILGTMMARVYLGVHSIYDVTCGCIVGALTLYLWHRYNFKNALQKKCFQRDFWWITGVLTGSYILSSRGMEWPIVAIASLGTLVGFGLSLRWITSSTLQNQPFDLRTVIHGGVGLVAIALLTKVTPIVETTDQALLFLKVTAKYALIIMTIFVGIPKLLSAYNKPSLY
jgi:membrane-associated phospholipid phosphatase